MLALDKASMPFKLLTWKIFCPVVLFFSLHSAASFANDYADLSYLIKIKQYPEALAKADLLLTTKPRDPQLRFLKGVTLGEMGKTQDAITLFTSLTQDYPELPEPYNNLAVIYANSNQLAKARQSLEMAIRTNPSYAVAHENLGDIYAKMASQSYAKALQIEVNNPAASAKLTFIQDLFSLASPTAKAANTPSSTDSLNTSSSSSANTDKSIDVVASTNAHSSTQTSPNTAVKTPVTAKVASTSEPSTSGSLTKPSSPITLEQEVSSAVAAWAKAWSSRKLVDYLGSYAKNFAPPNDLTRAQWEKDRELKITGKKKISVTVSNLQIKLDPNQTSATVRFKQNYQANSLAASTYKTLEMTKSGTRWLITKETSS